MAQSEWVAETLVAVFAASFAVVAFVVAEDQLSMIWERMRCASSSSFSSS